jgi:hypothetical protein
METIQRMALDGSPLALLAQQGAEAANLIVAEVEHDGYPCINPTHHRSAGGR